MSSNVQSIICCLGDPVAGNPTQFLMQRAAGALGIDWMFVTAEVPASKIEEAFQGIRALRFSGVAFLPPHRSIGCKLVDSMTEAATRSGHVRIARRDGDLWLGDDSLGAAIVELLKSQPDYSAEDDAIGSRQSIVVLGETHLSHLVRLALSPAYADRVVGLIDTKTSEISPSAEVMHGDEVASTGIMLTRETNIPSASCASIPMFSFDDLIHADLVAESLIVDASASCLTPRQIAKIRWSKNPVAIFVEPNPKWDAALSAIKIEGLRILRPMDLAAAKAVVSFQFWTGHSIDLASIRESLDEYCQW